MGVNPLNYCSMCVRNTTHSWNGDDWQHNNHSKVLPSCVWQAGRDREPWDWNEHHLCAPHHPRVSQKRIKERIRPGLFMLFYCVFMWGLCFVVYLFWLVKVCQFPPPSSLIFKLRYNLISAIFDKSNITLIKDSWCSAIWTKPPMASCS